MTLRKKHLNPKYIFAIVNSNVKSTQKWKIYAIFKPLDEKTFGVFRQLENGNLIEAEQYLMQIDKLTSQSHLS